jgi:hypothetical protein
MEEYHGRMHHNVPKSGPAPKSTKVDLGQFTVDYDLSDMIDFSGCDLACYGLRLQVLLRRATQRWSLPTTPLAQGSRVHPQVMGPHGTGRGAEGIEKV